MKRINYADACYFDTVPLVCVGVKPGLSQREVFGWSDRTWYCWASEICEVM